MLKNFKQLVSLCRHDISRGRTHNMQKSGTGRLLAVALGLSLVAAACGDDEETTSTTAAAASATTMAEEAAATTMAEEAAATTMAEEGAATTMAEEGSATTRAAAMGDDTGLPTPTGAVCEGGVTLAFIGALSGDNGALGTNMINGASVAIDAFNEANPDCQVTFDTAYDSQGDPAQATPLAATIANNEAIIGLIGPGFSGETNATMPTFDTAGLHMITPGATNALLSTNGWTTFHRVLANDDLQAPGVVQLIEGTIGGTKVGVIDDASDYGKGLADAVKTGLGDALVAEAVIDPKAADYSAAITAMADAEVDTIFYSGYYAEAAKMLQQIRDAGIEATFVSGDGTLDPAFIENSGEVSEGTYLTATGAPSDINANFAAAFDAAHGTEPRLYSPEAYDAAYVFLSGIAAGNTTRESLGTWIDGYDAAGITKQISFSPEGEPAGSAVYYTVVEGGVLVGKGLIP